MRNLILTTLSIIGGLSTVHAQNWVPFGFHAFKQRTPKSTEVKVEHVEEKQEQQQQVAEGEPVAENLNSTDSLMAPEGIIALAEETNEDIFAAPPNLAYAQAQSNTANPNKNYWKCKEFFWIEGDYVLAWSRHEKIDAPLITTSSAPATDTPPGAIGQPGTKVVYGDKRINFERAQGVRGALGAYANENRSFSFDIDAFWIFEKSKHFKISSDGGGNPLIARPFFDVRTSSENAELVSSPGTLSGTSIGRAKTQVWGGEVNIGYHPCRRTVWGDIFFGFRYLRLKDKISVQDNNILGLGGTTQTFNTVTVSAPDTLSDEDDFKTTNNFYGGQVGARVEIANRWWSLGLFGKIGLGVTQEKYATSGFTTWNSAAFGKQYAHGGVLVQPNNEVELHKNVFGIVPEAGAHIGFEPLKHLRFLVGYSFLWWNKVIRPGKQIDRNVNSGQIPRDTNFFTGAAQPRHEDLDQERYWLQTINIGVAFDF